MGKIMILLEGPSKYDEIAGQPLHDQTGQQFIKFLHMAGIIYNDCVVTHVCPTYIQEPRNKNKKKLRYYSKHTPKYQILKPEVEANLPKVRAFIEKHKPTVILACGELSMNILTDEVSVTKQRGSILQTTDAWPYCKVIPTYTPNQLQLMYEWSFQFLSDAKRAQYESQFPEIQMPPWELKVRPTADETIERLAGLLEMAAIRPEQSRAVRLYLINGDGWLEYSAGKSADVQSADEILTTTPNNKYLMSVDVETRQGYITCVGIAWTPWHSITIPLLAVDGDPHYFTEQEEKIIIGLLRRLFYHDNIEWALQNENYDFQYFISQWGLLPRHHCDTMQMHHTCWSGMKKSLDFQASLKLRFYRYWKDEGKEFHEKIKTPEEEYKYWEYNGKDCVVTYELALYNYLELQRYNQLEQYRFQMQQQHVALLMMLRGTRAHLEKRGELATQLMSAISDRQNRLEYIIGQPLNISSPQQVQTFLYKTLGQKKVINKYSGNPTTDDKALELIGVREPVLAPVMQIIQELRSLKVFLGTFVKAPPSPDKRYRTAYKVAGTETFRWASSKDVFGQGLNLQNIPKGTEK